MKNNIIQKKTYSFALKIIQLYISMRKENEFVLSNQLVRAGTSIGANVEEAEAGQTKKDFIAKMAIASKEARETNYWLRLFRDSGLLDPDESSALIGESKEIIRILTSIVKTSQLKNNVEC
jgi:four helix bundle protein